MITTFVVDRRGRRLSPYRLRPQQRLPRQAAELHDPLQPLRAPRLPGAAERQLEYKKVTTYRDVPKIPVNPSGFGCPCHGGQYDTEGNRTAGPPVRALDRYSFSIVNGHLFARQAVLGLEGRGQGREREDPRHEARVPRRARRAASSPGSTRSSLPTDGDERRQTARSGSSTRSTGSRSARGSSARSATSSSATSRPTSTGSRRSARRR